MVDVVAKFGYDPNLDVDRALRALLCTTSHLIMRFDWYSQYPTKIWELSVKYNAEAYLPAIYIFLDAPKDVLDLGFSWPLQQVALKNRTHAEAAEFLQSEYAQSEIDGVLEAAAASSLDVERKHQLSKRSEARRVKHASAASRDGILEEYRRERANCIQTRAQDLGWLGLLGTLMFNGGRLLLLAGEVWYVCLSTV